MSARLIFKTKDQIPTMGNDTHVTDVGGLVHEGPNLVCELHVPYRNQLLFDG